MPGRLGAVFLLGSSTLVWASTLVAPAPADEAPGWRRITGPPTLVFPRDHGAHLDTRNEWWYVTGLVTDSRGRRFGFQITFFRQGLASGKPEPGRSTLRARQVAAAHLAIAEIDGQRFHHAERLRRAGGGLAGWSERDADVWLEDWALRRTGRDIIEINARDAASGLGLQLELSPTKPLVRHGHDGYSRKGPQPGNASAYVSWPRLAVEGRVELESASREVVGSAWLDHEWGTSQLGVGVAGWDWLSLRLDDGRDLMLYQLRRDDGARDSLSSGTMVDADGTPTRIAHDQFEMTPLDWWTSPLSGGRYPVRWRILVPSHGLDLEVGALLPSCELDGSATTGVIYWEGPIEAAGAPSGSGYMELTGYAGSLAGRF